MRGADSGPAAGSGRCGRAEERLAARSGGGLAAEAALPAGAGAGPVPTLLGLEASWAQREFGRSELADGRLRARLERMAAAWERHPGAPLPAIFPGAAEQQAAYRFLHNGKVAGEDILQHREALLERVRQESTVLLVQDTTTLNYKRAGAGAAAGAGQQRAGAVRARGGGVHGRPCRWG